MALCMSLVDRVAQKIIMWWQQCSVAVAEGLWNSYSLLGWTELLNSWSDLVADCEMQLTFWRRKKRESWGGKVEFQQEGFIINLLPWLLLLPWSLSVKWSICNWIWKFQTPSAGWEQFLKCPFHGFETCTLNPQPFLKLLLFWYTQCQ